MHFLNLTKSLLLFSHYRNLSLVNKYAPDLSSTSSVDPIELAGLFEGDIVLSDDGMNGNGGKNGITDPSRKWPGGVVPYTISNSYSTRKILINTLVGLIIIGDAPFNFYST